MLCRRAQFLDSKETAAIEHALPSIPEPSRRPAATQRSAAAAYPSQHQRRPDDVWVDCYFYGFYMEKSKVPAFTASLRQQMPQTATAH